MTTTMMRCITVITFEQQGEGRNQKFTFDFVHEFEVSSSWVDLTNQAKITLPKNIYVKDANGDLLPLGGTGQTKLVDNLFRRGDKVTINFGYYTYNNGREYKDLPQEPIFKGYISRVTSKKPIVLECEDNMWLLKQIPCKPQVWSKNKSLEDLFKELLTGTPFTVNSTTQTSVGDLAIGNETVAQLLARLRKDFHLEAYFKGNELRLGSLVYLPSDNEGVKPYEFIFQQNIISDDLQFQRKDDVKLSAVCNSVVTKVGSNNKKGQQKTKQQRLSVLVYTDAKGEFKYIEKQQGVDFPANDEGERRTLFYPNISTAKELFELGKNELSKYYYNGFKGNFTTFGIPYVQFGDDIVIKDRIMPDRNGKYKVRGVKYSGGINGHRQVVTLDYKLL